MRRIFALFWLLSFCSSFFFSSSQTGVCFCVLLLKILEYEGERVFCGRALTVVLKRLRVKGVEGRSTLRLTMIIKAMNLPFYEPCGGFDFNE